MDRKELFKHIDEKIYSKEEIADWIIQDPKLLSLLFDACDHKRANVKYGSEKILRILSSNASKIVYPHFDKFVEFLLGDNKFLRLGAIIIISNLTRVDSENKFGDIAEQYFTILQEGDLTSTSNLIKSIPFLIQNKPQYEDQIIKLLLDIPNVTFETDDCRNIVIGHTIDSFHKIYPKSKSNAIFNFVLTHQNNARPSTVKRANKFLKKYPVSI